MIPGGVEIMVQVRNQNEQEILISWEVHVMRFHVDTNNKNLMRRLERERLRAEQ